jgi:hypothetical protein
MKHSEIKKLLGAYVDGELKKKVRSEVEEHLKTCTECMEEVEFIRALEVRMKEDGIVLPPDSYWDHFPKRVMSKISEKPSPGFFTAWVPRLKWELAGAVMILLLTFVVSKQIITKRVSDGIDIPYLPKVSEKIVTGKAGWDERDGERKEEISVSGGKTVTVQAEEKAVAKKGEGEPEGRFEVMEEKAEIEREKPLSSVSKAPDVMKKAKDLDISGTRGGAEGEVSEEEVDKTSADGYFQNAARVATEEVKENEEIISDIEVQEEYVRNARNRVESIEARRGLIRLLFAEAGRTQKRTDITRVQREIEIYKDSFPDDFDDTLSHYSDSLEVMLEGLEEVGEESTEETEKSDQ